MAYREPYPVLSSRLSDANRILNAVILGRSVMAFDSAEPPELDVPALRKALRACLDALPAEASEDTAGKSVGRNTDDSEDVDHRRDFDEPTPGEREDLFALSRDDMPPEVADLLRTSRGNSGVPVRTMASMAMDLNSVRRSDRINGELNELLGLR